MPGSGFQPQVVQARVVQARAASIRVRAAEIQLVRGPQVSIEMRNAGFEPNVAPAAVEGPQDFGGEAGESRVAGNSVMAAGMGAALALCFYGIVVSVPWQPLQRYFLGHPVAIAATVLFWFAMAVLIAKWLEIVAQTQQLAAIHDEDLIPPQGESSPAGRWLEENDAGHVARNWLAAIGELSDDIRGSHLVSRLAELLTRQSQRGTTKHLADDLRELSARDADAAHDSLGLVRIIVWAIPMLGFLGTVIGITQTLGGLDFANGTAAVQNLKSGLYVAFDTTALGLVLSVVAIFLQFPIERSEQRLLATIDARVGHLVSARLPSDETSDNQTALIADLCRGVQAAVAESLDNQAKLWRDTIDEAQRQWQTVHEDNSNKITEALESTLVPALNQHAKSIAQSSLLAGDKLGNECDRWKESLDEARHLVRMASDSTAETLVGELNQIFTPALRDHAANIDESSRIAGDRLERQWQQLQETMSYHSDSLSTQQLTLVRQYEALTETHLQAESISALQQSLDANLQRLTETNAAIDRSVAAAAGDGMADAMRILARAVDVLSDRLAEAKRNQPEVTRRAA